ncbi:Tetratricopeptide repeat-containing protein [Lentzea fradiae]|uniref:Tetratricopeptide repeat-containing protein n=1 Tax=Lentzea fradiae TaxID=200378 RepID=A0A1G8ABN6_9PSEU|nr:tetratricopeptide repeat protein [Lentzea fradiae]SDH18299.1 Tetratricopeptide repeat-containing protein [Lentzea fradiae]
MPDDLPGVRNSAENVSGQVVQVGVVHGDVHLGGLHADRLPLRVGVVPSRAASFQERAVGLADRVVLSGLGGVGKTQLAARHAETSWAAGEIRLLVWVSATSRDAITSAYADAAAKLTGQDGDARTFLEWLGNTSEPWLVVLDDVQAPADLNGLWPPAGGRVVVTTRRRDAALRGDRVLVDLDVFSPSEARAYLSAAIGADDDADRLADALGHLPLALAQAAAYVLDRRITCAEYLTRFTERRLAVMAPDELPDEHRATVAATWSLSVERADSMTPRGVARPLLDIASALDANGIPLDVFTSEPVLAFLGVDEADARDGLGCLHRLSLVTLDPDAREVRVHALLQRATRDAWTDASTVIRVAADALLEAWPDGDARTFRANAQALRAAGERWLWQDSCHPVLFRLGVGIASHEGEEAAAYFDELRRTAAGRLGPDHVDTLTARYLVVRTRDEPKNPRKAAEAYEELLANQLRTLGADHVRTLATRRSLWSCRGRTGDSATAAEALRGVLTDQLRVLGPDHHEVLATREDIVSLLRRAGDVASAADAAGVLLADSERVLGPDDPQTMLTRVVVADLHGERGDAVRAVAEYRALLADRIRVLADDHRAVWSSRRHLVHWLARAGDVLEARTECRRLLQDQVRVLGARHPDVRRTRELFLGLSE